METKLISQDARALLEEVREAPHYLRHFYDEDNSIIIVWLNIWFCLTKVNYPVKRVICQGYPVLQIPYDFKSNI